MKIHSSSNYTHFTPNPFQRAFLERKAAEIAAKMKVNGFTPSMAISVYRARDGSLTINTGHHRFEAAKSLGIPILYVIEDQWSLRQLVDEGTTGSKWNNLASTQAFAKSGKKDYQELLAYADKGLPLAMAASMLIGEGASSGNAAAKITAGTFKIKSRIQADKIIALFEKFIRVPAIRHRPFITAYSKCLFTKEFDEAVFAKRLKANPTMLEKTSNEEQMLKIIEEIYNFKSTKKIPLAFLVTENSKARKETFGKL